MGCCCSREAREESPRAMKLDLSRRRWRRTFCTAAPPPAPSYRCCCPCCCAPGGCCNRDRRRRWHPTQLSRASSGAAGRRPGGLPAGSAPIVSDGRRRPGDRPRALRPLSISSYLPPPQLDAVGRPEEQEGTSRRGDEATGFLDLSPSALASPSTSPPAAPPPLPRPPPPPPEDPAERARAREARREARRLALERLVVDGGAPNGPKPGSVVFRGPGSVGPSQRMSVRGLVDCVVVATDAVDSVVVEGCRGCRFVLGPASGSIFLRDCTDCAVIALCGQFRARDCTRLDVALLVSSRPALEDSTGVRVAPCLLEWPGLADQLRAAGLSPLVNRWSEVHDFTAASGAPGAAEASAAPTPTTPPPPRWSPLPVDVTCDALLGLGGAPGNDDPTLAARGAPGLDRPGPGGVVQPCPHAAGRTLLRTVGAGPARAAAGPPTTPRAGPNEGLVGQATVFFAGADAARVDRCGADLARAAEVRGLRAAAAHRADGIAPVAAAELAGLGAAAPTPGLSPNRAGVDVTGGGGGRDAAAGTWLRRRLERGPSAMVRLEGALAVKATLGLLEGPAFGAGSEWNDVARLVVGGKEGEELASLYLAMTDAGGGGGGRGGGGGAGGGGM